jgi:hypothetical protein
VEDIAELEGVSPEDVDPSRAQAIVITGGKLLEISEEELDRTISSHREIVFAR